MLQRPANVDSNPTQAKNYFGNEGCYIDDMEDVKMSKIERTNVGQIVAVEKALGC